MLAQPMSSPMIMMMLGCFAVWACASAGHAIANNAMSGTA